MTQSEKASLMVVIVVFSFFIAVSIIHVEKSRIRIEDMEQRIERLETRMAGQAAATDYFHQEIDKLKGD